MHDNNPMTNQAGLNVTFPYVTDPAVARYQCQECGGWERADKKNGWIRHSKRCDSKPQAAPSATDRANASLLAAAKTPAKQLDREIAESVRDSELRAYADNVRRTGLTKGRTEDLV